jgi:hypothetical protein
MAHLHEVGPGSGRSVARAAEDLQGTLGSRLTAYAVGLRDSRLIDSFARAETDPPPETADRICDLYEITQCLVERETPDTARAWMVGSSPLLDDQAPVEVLHEQSRVPTRPHGRRAAKDGFQRVQHAANVYVGAA